MDIKFQGFELSLAEGPISWDQYWEHLRALSRAEIDFGPHKRIICLDFDADADHILGLIVSVKDQKKFCEIFQQGGQIKLSARSLTEGSRMADFNFFIIRKGGKDGIFQGLYQYYHQSFSTTGFTALLARQFGALKENLIGRALERSDEGKSKIKKEIKVLRKAKFDARLIVKSETFYELLERLDEVHKAQLQVTTLIPENPKTKPISDAKRQVLTVTFDRERGMGGEIVQAIREFRARYGSGDAKVAGVSRSGLDVTISSFKNVEDFGRCDYNELMEEFTVDLDNFSNSEMLRLLIGAAKDNDHIIS